jgi:hypothetical protein
MNSFGLICLFLFFSFVGLFLVTSSLIIIALDLSVVFNVQPIQVQALLTGDSLLLGLAITSVFGVLNLVVINIFPSLGILFLTTLMVLSHWWFDNFILSVVLPQTLEEQQLFSEVFFSLFFLSILTFGLFMILMVNILLGRRILAYFFFCLGLLVVTYAHCVPLLVSFCLFFFFECLYFKKLYCFCISTKYKRKIPLFL